MSYFSAMYWLYQYMCSSRPCLFSFCNNKTSTFLVSPNWCKELEQKYGTLFVLTKKMLLNLFFEKKNARISIQYSWITMIMLKSTI